MSLDALPPTRRRSVAASLGTAYRGLVTRGRWLMVVLWVLAAALVTPLVPAESSGGDTFGDLLPPDSTVLKVRQRVLEQFRVPVISGTTWWSTNPAA